MKKHFILPFKNKSILIIATVLLLYSFTGPPYRNKQHELITNRALAMYELKYKKLPDTYKKAFWKGLKRDDRKYPWRLYHKWKNQHFYNPYKNHIAPKTKNANRTLDRLHTKLKRLLVSLKTKKDTIQLYDTLGNICHYLQDFTNPAHVVPIFHATADGFDQHELYCAMFDKKIDRTLFNGLDMNDDKFLSQLIENTALNTLTSLTDSIKIKKNTIEQKVPLSAFWVVNNDPNSCWFSTYGILANGWGKNKFWINPEDTNLCKAKRRISKTEKDGWDMYELQTSNTDVFTAQQVSKARDVTFKALEFIHLKLENKKQTSMLGN